MPMTDAEFDSYLSGIGGGRAAPSSSIGAGWGAGKANWQAGMGAVGGAIARALGGSTPDLDAWVQQKTDEAGFYQRNAPGATSFFGEGGVTDDGKLMDWLAFNFGQSAPYVLEMLAGGVAGGLARGAVGGGVRAFGKDMVAGQAARTAGEGTLTAASERALLERAANEVGTRVAAGAGAVGASYPSAVGDILLNQRDAGGEDLAAAAAGGTPYALLNLLGGEGAVLRAATGGAGRAGSLLKSLPGAMARAGGMEGVGETAQELINQSFGRMAVNPEETLTSSGAPMRYAESFMAGLGLGAPMGGVAQVFSKPQIGSPEEIAARKESLQRATEQVLSGNETWRETMERGRAEEADYQKELETSRAEEGKAAEEQAKLVADAAKAAADAKKAAVEAKHKAWLASQDDQIRSAMGEGAIGEAVGSIMPVANFDIPPTGFIPAPTVQDVRAEADTAMQRLIALAGSKRPVRPEKMQAAMAEQTRLSGLLDSMVETANAGRRGPDVTEGAVEYLRKVNREQGALLESQQEQAALQTLNRPKPPVVRTAMEEALLGALKPLQEDAAWRKFIAEKDAQKQVEIDAAHAANPAGLRDAKLVQGDLIGFENQAVAKPGAPAETVPNLADFNEWQAEGLQISADWAKARAAKDASALSRLEKQAQALYERAALGFPKAPGTAEMFQLREGEASPRVTPAAKAASGNWFKQPKEKARGTETVKTEQTRETAPAEAPASTVKPDLNTLLREKIARDELATKLADKFNQRKTLTAAEAKRVLDEEAEKIAVQPTKEKQDESVPAEQGQDAVPAQEEREDATQEETLPELNAAWNTRVENRGRVEKAAAKGDEARIAREWNEQYGNKFQYPELERDLQLLVKHAIEAVEKQPNGRTQSKMSVELADRIELEQEIRNRGERDGDVEVEIEEEAVQTPLDIAEETLLGMGGDGAGKAAFWKYAQKLVKQGLLTEDDLRQVEQIKSDRDMSADDMQSEIESSLRRPAPTPAPVAEPAPAAPKTDLNAMLRAKIARDEAASAAPRAPMGEMDQINARIAELEAKQDDEYLPGRAELLDKLYDRAARLEEKASGLREQSGLTDKEAAAEAVIADDEMQEVVEPHSFGKVKGTLADDTTPDYPENEFIGSSDTPWVVAKLEQAPTIQQMLAEVARKGDLTLGYLAGEISQLAGIGEVKIEYDPKPGYNDKGKRIGGFYDPVRNRVTLYDGGATAHTVMHEIIHAVTMHRIEQAQELSRNLATDRNVKMTPEEEALLDTYSKLSRLRIEAAVAAEKRGLGKMYGLQFGKNAVAEFVAEAMTNPGFQQFLKSVPSTEQSTSPSIWKSFVNAVKHMLGFTKDEMESVLARVLELTPGVVATRREARYIGTQRLENAATLATPVTPVSGAFVNQTQTASNAIGALARIAADNAPMMARSAGATMAKMARSVLDWTHTQRGAAMIHPQLGRLVGEASDMLRTKERILTRMNELQRGFLVSQRPTNWKGDLSPVGKYVNEMLEATLNRYSEGIPKPLLDKMAKVAKAYLMDNKVLYTDEAYSGMKKLLPSLETDVMLSEEEFRKGVKIAKQDRTVSVPAGMSDEDFVKAYAAYKSAMLTMADSHIQKLVSAELQAQELMEGEVKQLPRRYKGEALKSMTALRDLYAAMYARISELDLAKDKTTQSDAAVGVTLERTSEILYGLARGMVLYNSAEAKLVADNLQVSLAQLETYMKPLVEKYNDAGANDKVGVAKDVRNDIVGAARISRVKEARVYTAVKELFGLYVPARRTGDWTIRLKLVDQDGNDLIGKVRMADGSVQDTGAVLDVIQFGDSKLFSEGESILTQVHNDLNKALATEGQEIEVEVQAYDSVGKPMRNPSNVLVTKTVKAKLAWTKPERTRAHRSVAQRLSPIQMKTNLEVMGITLTPEQQERMVVGMTNQEAAIRGRLMRHFVPGYSTEFKQVLADYLGSVASSVAIAEHGHRLQLMAAPEADGWVWSAGDEKARAAMEKRVAEAKTGDEKVYWKKEADRLNFDKNRVGEAEAGLPKLQNNAREYIEYILGQDQIEENITGLTKARSIVTILQLGGTLASPLTNLSSIPLHTFSYLSSYSAERAYGGGFSPAAVAATITKALTNGAIGKTLAKNAEPFVNWTEGEIWIAEEYYRGKVKQATETGADVDGYSLAHWQFLQRAASEGVLGAQKHNELLALRKRAQFGPRVSKAVSHYMALFAATEEYNRTVTGLASFDLFYDRAIKGGAAPAEAASQAYDQAVKAIYDTQGEYNQINRPKLFRSDLGSLVFLYKTFVITTLEMLRNLPPKGRAIFLGSLYGMSGTGGLPLLDEFWLVLDVAAQKTGLGLGVTKGNAERAFAEFARDMGESMGWEKFDQVAMRGVLDTYLGTELFGRAGVQVGVPMAGMLRPGAKLMEEIGRSLGAFGGAVEGAEKAADKLVKGDFEGAFRAVPITAVKNFADAYSYAKYDAVVNKRGQVVTKSPGGEDILARASGFYPSELKWVNDQVRREEYTRAYAKELKTAFTEEYREAYIQKDTARMSEVAQMVRDHNENFRGTALEMVNFEQTAKRSGKEAALTLRERAQKTLSKAQQRDSALKE